MSSIDHFGRWKGSREHPFLLKKKIELYVNLTLHATESDIIILYIQPPSSAGLQSRGRSQKFAEQRGGTLIRTIMGWQQFFSHFIFRYKRFQVNRVWLVLKRIECLLWFDLANKSCVSEWCGRGRECWNLLASYGRSHKLNCNTVNFHVN